MKPVMSILTRCSSHAPPRRTVGFCGLTYGFYANELRIADKEAKHVATHKRDWIMLVELCLNSKFTLDLTQLGQQTTFCSHTVLSTLCVTHQRGLTAFPLKPV